MKKINYFTLLFVFIILCGCTKKTAPSLVDFWQKKHLKSSDGLLRSIASLVDLSSKSSSSASSSSYSSSSQISQCLGDFMNSKSLQQEVLEYESRVQGNPVRGFWKHINLSSLPITQANFLIKYGTSIGDMTNPEAIDYSECTDLVCIFNKVYNKESDYIAGYVHYLWYLKFGTYLSLDNYVYKQIAPQGGVYNNQSYPLSSYLYDESELYGLWRLTHILDGQYTILKSLREVQRVPRGSPLEGYEKTGSCGLAYGDSNIVLNDGCLATLQNDRDQGFLYRGIIHEFSHVVDYSEARRKNLLISHRSIQQDYLDLVGFYKEEYVNATGVLVSEWKLKPEAKYIRDYAAKNPVENFAESLAVYRYVGDLAKSKLHDNQYKWIGKNYFDSEEFDSQSNTKRFLNKYKSKYMARAFFNVLNCSKENKIFASSYFTTQDFPKLRFSSSMLTCLSAQTEDLANKFTAEVRRGEIEGCSTIKSQASLTKWNGEVKNILKESIISYVEKMAKNPDFLNQMNNFNEILATREMANEAILNCYDGNINKNLLSCYNLEVVKITSEKGLSIGIPENHVGELASLYLGSFPYRNVMDAFILSYKSIIESHDENIRLKTQELWNQCFDLSQNDNETPATPYYTPSRGYLVSSILNCLNTKLPETLENVIKTIEFEGLSIKNEKEKMVMREFINPTITGLLDAIYDEKQKEEQESLGKIFDEQKDKIVEFLISDFAWVKSIDDKKQNISSCKMASLGQINFLPLYQVKRDAFGSKIESEICEAVINNKEEFKKFIEDATSSLDKEVYSRIEPMLTLKAEERANLCLRKIPWKWEKTKITVRIPRKICLSTDWKNIEAEVMSELLAGPTVARFNVKKEVIAKKLKSYEDGIKEQVSGRFF